MENSFIDEILNIIVFLVITAILISSAIFIIDDINASAQELETITLKAGTYRFNDVLNAPNTNILQEIAFTTRFVVEEMGIDSLMTFSSMYVPSDASTFFLDGYCISVDPIFDLGGYEMSGDMDFTFYNGGWELNSVKSITLPEDTAVDDAFGNWFIVNTNYNEVNSNNAITIPYINVDISTDLQIMENINMDINGFGSTTSNDIVGITALNGDTLGRIRTNDGTTISFNGIAVTSFDSWRTTSTYVYPLTDDVIATTPFTITNGLMLYLWDDTQYYQVAWYNPTDGLWYVHGDYAIIVPYGQRSTTSIGTLTDGIALSMSITPNLTVDDLGYVELGGFEDTPPYDNIITTADEDAYSTFAMFCNANFISDSEKLSWGIAQHQSGQNLGQSQQLGDNILGQFLQAPIDILDSIVIYTTPNGTSVTLMGVFGALLTLSLVIIFLKLFAGG